MGMRVVWSAIALGLATHAWAAHPLDAMEVAGRAPVEPVAVDVAPPVVIAGGTVLTATGQTFSPGWVSVRDGRIAAVGGGDPPLEPGVAVVDATGRYVTPGLIDTHSHLGVYPSPAAGAHSDGNEATAPTTPGVWAEHSFWPQDPGLERAIAGGVTTLQVLPGSANLIGGRGVVLHLTPARGSRAMRFPGAPETVKMACGENPKRVYGEKGGPSTRMGNVEGHRAAFFEARAFLDDWDTYAEDHAEWAERTAAKDASEAAGKKYKGEAPGDAPEPPDRDLDLETLALVLRGEALVQVHCYRADDMLSFLQVADEAGFTIRSFHHALEAYKIRDVLATRGIASSTWADWWGFKLEAYDGIPHNAGLLTEAGARTILHSDSAIGIQRLNQEAGKAWRSGLEAGVALTADEVLRWITLHPAWALGIDDQVGSLEPGKRADVVVWDHDPLSVYARADLVFIDGVLRYDADRPTVWSDFEIGQGVTP